MTSCSLNVLGAALLKGVLTRSRGLRDDVVGVAGLVDAVSFLDEVVGPVGVEVAVAAYRVEFEVERGKTRSPQTYISESSPGRRRWQAGGRPVADDHFIRAASFSDQG